MLPDASTEVASGQHTHGTPPAIEPSAAKPPKYAAWEEFLATSGPYPYIWTVSFVRPYPDHVLLKALWQSARFINRELWGPRWDRKQCGLRGTVVAEPHRTSLHVRGRLHFHVLLHEQEGNADIERLREAASSASLRLTDASGRRMSAPDRVNVKGVWDMSGLAGYLTKNLATPHWACGENIFFVRPSGIEGNVMPARGNAALKRLH